MKKGFLLSCVLSLAMLGGGYWLGKRNATQAASPTAGGNVATESSQTKTPALPPEKKSPGDNSAAAATSRKTSLAEIEAKLRGMNVNMGRYGGQQDIVKILASVDRSEEHTSELQ